MHFEQAVEALREDFIENSDYVADPESVVALGMPTLLASAGDEVAPYRAADPNEEPVPTTIAGDTWVFMVDRAAGAGFPHAVTYVFVDAASGTITAREEQWFPVYNGVAYFNSPAEILSGANAVYAGERAPRGTWDEAVQIGQEAAAFWASAEGEARAAEIRRRGNPFQPWTGTTCSCPDPKRVALIVEGVGYRNLVAPTAGLAMMLATDAFGVLLDFDEVRLLTPKSLVAGGVPNQATVDSALADYVRRLRPCDVFVLYYVGHSVDGTLSIENVDADWTWEATGVGSMEYLFALLQPRNKYLILDACHMGAFITYFDSWVTRYSQPLNLEMMTSSSATRSSTGALLTTCLVDVMPGMLTGHINTFDEWHHYTSMHVLELWEAAYGRGEPQYRRFEAPDTDADGLTDALEERLGTDTLAWDSDGDDSCDGDELRPAMPIRFNTGGLTNTPAIWQVTGNGKVRTDLPRPPIPRETTLPPGIAGVAYSQQVQVAPGRGHGTPLTFSLVSGALPAGLSIDAAGLITGVPQAAAAATFTLRIQDDRGAAADTDLSLTIEYRGLMAGGRIGTSLCALVGVRDTSITLGEALALANGTLLYADLTPEERALVTPPVGLANQDTIAFACTGPVALPAIDSE
ncbi:MAG: putative Ig domain-containing protein [Candidatus Schekmanbacteria bacterium]|nr:putative Ig domain-containing protein [Candidatus Schekmanbacteria bacterium]